MDDERAPQHGRWLQRAAGTAAAVGLALAAGLYYTHAGTAAEGPGTTEATESDPDASGPTSQQPSTPLTGGAAPVDGPGVTEPGVLLSFAPVPGDRVDVSESVLLARPNDRVVLRAPRVRRAAGSFGDLQPRAIQLQLTVDGQPVVVPSELGQVPVTIRLPERTDRYQLRYLLVDTTVRSVPSTTGRALVALGSLTRASARRDVMVVGDDPSILNLTCPLVSGDATACADAEDGGWRLRTPLPGSDALVVAQIDLPAP